MFNTEFNAWLQGFLLVADPKILTERQCKIIKSHIRLTSETCNGELTLTNAWIFENIDCFDVKTLVTLVTLVRRDFYRKPIMSSHEISYFVQGVLEIGEELQFFTPEQCHVIAEEIERNVDGLNQTVSILYWNLRDCEDDNTNFNKLKELRADMNELFHHVIDPSYEFGEEKASKLQKVHDSYKEVDEKSSFKVTANC
jgi:hypothetical protein